MMVRRSTVLSTTRRGRSNKDGKRKYACSEKGLHGVAVSRGRPHPRLLDNGFISVCLREGTEYRYAGALGISPCSLCDERRQDKPNIRLMSKLFKKCRHVSF